MYVDDSYYTVCTLYMYTLHVLYVPKYMYTCPIYMYVESKFGCLVMYCITGWYVSQCILHTYEPVQS